MKKRIIGIFIVTLLIVTALPAFGITENQNTTNVILDELDQQSTKSDKVYAIGPSDKELAQSFTPTLPVLTKVILRLKSTGTPEFYYYYVDIKSSYLGSALTTAYIHRDTLVIGTNICEFDFPDISVTPGTKYYIILRGVSDSSDLSKVWWWYGYPDPYAGGDAWYESISGWNYLQEGIVRCDFCFETYGTAENNPPYAPVQPSGPTSGVVGVSYFYTTSAIDPDGDDIRYGWDWDGDGIVDEYSNLMNSGNVDSRSHAWTSTGTYNVKVKAKDEHDALSGFSSPLAVTITSGVNQPPNKPSTPSGPANGKTGTSYTYSTSTDDPDGDQVWYKWDWGDEVSDWDGPYTSGDPVTTSHTWSNQGTYAVKVKAKDTSDAESVWSDPLSVSMPKNKQYMPLGIILAFGFDVDVKIVQLEPGEDYVDLEVLNKPFYIWENEIKTINSGAFIRLYFAKGFFSPSVPICFGFCQDWGIIG